MALNLLARSKEVKGQLWKLPCATRSLCPLCRRVIDATLYKDDGRVLMNKICDEHGAFDELISSDARFFEKLRRTHYEAPQAISNPQCINTSQCPNECGLCDQHLSAPVMVNIELTNRCNMNCPICFANSNAVGRICELTLKQVDKMLDTVSGFKPYKPSCIQFVGGEPTIHKDFLEAVRHTKERGFTYVQVATNGLRFANNFEFCQAAAEAGLDQVYLQFDGLREEIYMKTRGRPLLETKYKAIENIKKANIRIVLVPTLVKGLNDDQVGPITLFAIENIDVISAISWQPVAITGRIDEEQRHQMLYTTADLARDLQEQLGFIDMYRDWYPFSLTEPFNKLMEVVTKKPFMRCSCSPHCGCATYLLVDKETNTVVPLPAFMDIELAMETLDKITRRIEKHMWMKDLSILQAMRSLKKHFHQDKAPQGWGFEDFLEFVKSFVEFGEQQSDMAAYMSDLHQKRFGMLLMASMHFQDVYNYEVSRSNHCVIFYAAPNGRFYPFCTWNSGPCHRYEVERQFVMS